MMKLTVRHFPSTICPLTFRYGQFGKLKNRSINDKNQISILFMNSDLSTEYN